MGTLKASMRNALPSKDFGEPGKRAYPMPDKSHAANAKARATQQERKGNLSPGAKAKIDRKANQILGKRSGSLSYSAAPDDSLLHPDDMPRPTARGPRRRR